MLFRIVDIETVPDPDAWKPGEPDWILRPGFKHDFAPNKEAAARFVGVTREGLAEICGLMYEKKEPFPPPQANRVVAVAWCDVEMRDTQVKEVGDVSVKSYEFVECHSLAGWDHPEREREFIRFFGNTMTAEPATLVTWNGRGFDLPVLSMRALRWGVPWGWYYDDRDVRYRYSDTGHVDLMDFLSDYGGSRQMKLDDAAHLIGLPGKAAGDGFDGSQVAELVAKGHNEKNRAKVARYCLQDVLQTALIFLRTRYHLGILDAEGYERSLKTFSKSKVVKEAIDVDWKRVSLGGAS